MVSPDAKRRAAAHAVRQGHSQRRSCKALGLSRSSVRYCRIKADEVQLVAKIRALAQKHKRYGCKRIHAELRRQGVAVNHKRVHRIWKAEGLSLGRKRPKRRSTGRKARSSSARPTRATYGPTTSSKTERAKVARSASCPCWTSSHARVSLCASSDRYPRGRWWRL